MIDTLVLYITFAVFLIGFWFVLQPLIVPYLASFRIRTKRTLNVTPTDGNSFITKTTEFLELSINKGTLGAAYTLIFIELLLFGLVWSGLMASGFTPYISFLYSLFLPIAVILFLNSKIYTNRVKISFEGLTFVTELVNNYKINRANLPEAIDQTIYSLRDKAPMSRQMLLNLSYRIRDAQTNKDIQKAVDFMVATMDVSWGKQLANLFKITLTKGEDVTQGLEDILVDLGELDRMYEKKRQLNMEGNFMLKVLLPLIVGAGFYLIFGVTDFTVQKYIMYQVVHPIGFKLLFFTVSAIMVSFLMHVFFTRSKNDY